MGNNRHLNTSLWIVMTALVIALASSCSKKERPAEPRAQDVTPPSASTPTFIPAPAQKPTQPILQVGLHQAARAGDLSALEASIQKGGDVNLLDGSGQTALHVAAWHGRDKAVQWLLDHKADPGLRDALGQTALDLALGAGQDPVVQVLAPSMQGDAALTLLKAAASGDVAMLKALLAKGQDVTARDGAGRTALHVAAARGRLEAIAALVTAKADVNATDSARVTPLHAAVKADRADCVAALLQAGADPNAADASGRTALYYAAATASPEVVKLLLKKGASTDRAGPDGTAGQVALAWGNIEAYDVLTR